MNESREREGPDRLVGQHRVDGSLRGRWLADKLEHDGTYRPGLARGELVNQTVQVGVLVR